MDEYIKLLMENDEETNAALENLYVPEELFGYPAFDDEI